VGAQDNSTAADGLVVALAEGLDEEFVTKDRALGAAAAAHAGVRTVVLTG
jgi:predicted nucleic acid-binding protein